MGACRLCVSGLLYFRCNQRQWSEFMVIVITKAGDTLTWPSVYQCPSSPVLAIACDGASRLKDAVCDKEEEE